MKILFYATSPNQIIGYGKIGNLISNYLASLDSVEFYYFSVGNFDHSKVDNRYINPKIEFIDVTQIEKERNIDTKLGFDLIEEYMHKIVPDMFIIYYDLITTCEVLEKIQKYKETNKSTKYISYIDLVCPFERIELLQYLDRNTDSIFVFTDFWKFNLSQVGINTNKIHIFYHIVIKDYIKNLSKIECRRILGLNDDDFVILNTNRNCYRKAIDITIKSFIKFFIDEKKNKRIKLFLNMFLDTNAGYNIINLILTACIEQRISFDDIKDQIITPPNNIIGKVSDEMMNIIYNACDVGINTGVAEGFGLCNFEHAFLGCPQIVSKIGGLQDIFLNNFSYVVNPILTIAMPNAMNKHTGNISYCAYQDFTEGMKFYFNNKNKLREHGVLSKKHINEKYNYEKILKKFSDDLGITK